MILYNRSVKFHLSWHSLLKVAELPHWCATSWRHRNMCSRNWGSSQREGAAAVQLVKVKKWRELDAILRSWSLKIASSCIKYRPSHRLRLDYFYFLVFRLSTLNRKFCLLFCTEWGQSPFGIRCGTTPPLAQLERDRALSLYETLLVKITLSLI